jgi:hypothetical protein
MVRSAPIPGSPDQASPDARAHNTLENTAEDLAIAEPLIASP